ncbi:adenine phosphoribosyltransferase [bacterium]|nr:adenine phosphoribosyltransferase [bacterium]
MIDLKSLIRNIPDFPKEGIGFKDITTLLKNGPAFQIAVNALCKPYRNQKVDVVVGIESRGFIFGGAMAVELAAGFVPVRKPGKLPAATLREEYKLEYGTDAVEIHRDAIQKGMKVLLTDDLLATGGTAAATIRLIKKLEGEVIGVAFLIELSFLKGREKIPDVPIHTLIDFAQE